MAKVIGTTEISFQIERIIKEAKAYLLVITPFLKFNERLKNIYKNHSNRVLNNFLIYRESEISKKEKEVLDSISNLKLINLPNIHAKCYMNESSALITSMNLHEYSEKNNYEIGIILDSKDDSVRYQELLDEVKLLFQITDNENYFEKIQYQHNYYTIGKLFQELTKKYEFEKTAGENVNGYTFFCKKAIEHYKFKEEELYKNGFGIKRDTKLKRETFYDLFNIIATTGKPKK